MEVIFVKDYDEMSKKGYEEIKEVIEGKNSPVISLNTGGTPKGLYQLLVDDIQNGLDIRHTTILSLDEYIGPKNAPYTVNTYMHDRLFDLIDQKPKNVFLMNGEAEDTTEEIKRYTAILEDFPRDIQLMGLGTNGHLGANEPDTSFDSTMFVADHRESTIQDTMKEYDLERKETPVQMLTLGFTEISEAQKVLLLVSGQHKAEAVKMLLEGEITPECPASILRSWDNVTAIIDEEAASLLNK